MSERLKSNHVEASKEQVQSLVELIKEYSEGKSKIDANAFIELFREREERRRGITDEEFWVLAKRAGISLPKELEPAFQRYNLKLPNRPGPPI